MPAADRVAGWRDALDAAGMPIPPHSVWHGEFGRSAGYAVAREALAGGGVDALFVASDEQATGVLRALADLGLRCPEDIAVASFDGIAEAAYTIPGLTTMAQPFSEIGREAVSALLARIDEPLRPRSGRPSCCLPGSSNGGRAAAGTPPTSPWSRQVRTATSRHRTATS